MSVIATVIPSRTIKRSAVLLSATCFSFLVLHSAALGTPNPGETPGRAHATQQRHARPAPDNGRLRSTPAVATKRPTFGWPALVTEARKYVGTNPTAKSKLWCATFMNMVLAKTGYAGTGSDAAKSFASYGKRINEPQVGAIAVLTRGKRGGHVGIVTGVDANGNPIIVSGNHGKRVGEATYPRNRVIAYVMPTDRIGATQVASAGPSSPRMSDADRDGGVSSPIDELLAAINAEREVRNSASRVTAQPAREPSRQNERAAQRPVERVVERAPARAAVQRPAVVPHRVVQQIAPSDIELPRSRPEAAIRVSAVVPNTPLPRERIEPPAAPMPRVRPQIN